MKNKNEFEKYINATGILIEFLLSVILEMVVIIAVNLSFPRYIEFLEVVRVVKGNFLALASYVNV